MKNKKILLETFIIPICLAYLLYYPLRGHDKINLILASIALILTALVFVIKYWKEVYVYEYKYNYLKVISIILNIILIILTILNLILKMNIIEVLFLVFTGIFVLYLIWFIAINIKPILTKEKGISQNIINAFLSLMSLSMILTCTLLYVL